MTNQIVLVQSLHNQHDAPVSLVVQASVQGVIEPVIDCFPLSVGESVMGFNGSSMMIRSAPLPVSTPPMDVDRRKPWRVVMNSCTA
jgi:hypothetical protein